MAAVHTGVLLLPATFFSLSFLLKGLRQEMKRASDKNKRDCGVDTVIQSKY